MPRLLQREEPTWVGDDELERTPAEAVPVNGTDPTAAHRAHIRRLNETRQAAEAARAHAARAHQVDVLAAEAERGHRRPRGSGWPATLRSVRTGKAE
jgi:hypothetical protein